MTAFERTRAESARRLGELASPIIAIGGVIGLGALAISVAIALFTDDWQRFLRSYLVAFMFVFSLASGALFFVILQHCVKAGWSVVIRRIAEGVASNLTWMWILFIPVLMGMGTLYHWLHPAGDEVLEHKAPFFFGFDPVGVNAAGEHVMTSHTPWFWLIRAVVYFGVWALLASFYFRNSVAQDESGDVRLTQKMERFAPVAVGLWFITQSFAAIDWVMSLSPHWFSTMFPVYFFAASCCGWFATQILLMLLVQRSGRLTNEITVEHYQDAGKLLFAFGVVFWAYIAFSQYMLIWYANLPEETPWYMARQLGGWLGVSLLLLLGHFLAPFLGIISRHPKRLPKLLAIGAGWMLVMHFVDVYWLAMPIVPEGLHYASSYQQLAAAVSDPSSPAATEIMMAAHTDDAAALFDIGYGWHLLDLTCVIGLLGVMAAGTAWRLSGQALIPERDPRLHESLAFENI